MLKKLYKHKNKIIAFVILIDIGVAIFASKMQKEAYSLQEKASKISILMSVKMSADQGVGNVEEYIENIKEYSKDKYSDDDIESMYSILVSANEDTEELTKEATTKIVNEVKVLSIIGTIAQILNTLSMILIIALGVSIGIEISEKSKEKRVLKSEETIKEVTESLQE